MTIETHCYSAFQSTLGYLRIYNKWQLAGNLNLIYKQRPIAISFLWFEVNIPCTWELASLKDLVLKSPVCHANLWLGGLDSKDGIGLACDLLLRILKRLVRDFKL